MFGVTDRLESITASDVLVAYEVSADPADVNLPVIMVSTTKLLAFPSQCVASTVDDEL